MSEAAPDTEDHGRPTVRGAMRNSVAIVSAQAAGNVVRLAAMLALLMALEREDYGTLTAAVAFVDPIRSLAVLGIDTVALRRAAIEPRRLPVIIGSLLRIRIVLGVLAFIVAGIAATTVRVEASGGPTVVLCAAISILPAAVYGPLETAFQARHQMRRLIGVPAIAAAAYLVTILVLWRVGAALPWFVAAAAISDTVAALLAARLVRAELAASVGSEAHQQSGSGTGSPVRLQVDRALCGEMVRQGLPLAFVNVVVVLYHRAGIYLVERTDDLGAVADLGAAVRLTLPMMMIGAALAVSLAPYASRLADDGAYDEFRRFFGRLVVRTVLIASPIALLGGWLADPVVMAIKPEYSGAIPAVRWMAFATVSMIVCQVSTASLVGLGTFRGIAVLESINLLLFLALAVPLVSSLGAEGAAAAMACMQALNACMQISLVLLVIRRRRRM